MNFKDLAAQIVMSKISGANNRGDASSALDDLIGGSNGFDLGKIVEQFQGSGGDLAKKAKSWLGDGANESISGSEVKEAIGSDKIEAFAKKIGISGDEATDKLSQILPELIDKSSQGGNLLSALGGKGGLLAGFASKFFKKSA